MYASDSKKKGAPSDRYFKGKQKKRGGRHGFGTPKKKNQSGEKKQSRGTQTKYGPRIGKVLGKKKERIK